MQSQGVDPMSPSHAAELVPIHQGKLSDLKVAREQLAAQGVEAEILRPPGCSTSS
jgi:hypothetical protein